MLICSITGDVNFGHLLWVVSAEFSHWRLAIFPL